MDPKRPGRALNADATEEILLRLPAKSVGRLRCVSKPWLSLLSDPLLLRSHAAAAPTESSGFYLYDPHLRQAEFHPLDGGGGGGHPDPTLSFLDYKGVPPEPVDSCNGLLLCRLPEKFKPELSVLSVCNPTTREHEVIPLPNDIRCEIARASLRLAFDPRRSPHYVIFAAASAVSTGDRRLTYKYASETRSWKRLEGGWIWGIIYWHWPPTVYWNGMLIWSVEFRISTLPALDVEGEHIRELSLPPPESSKKFLHLGALGERLHCIIGESYVRFEILELTPESSGWRLLHRVDLDSVERPSDQFAFTPEVDFIRGLVEHPCDRFHCVVVVEFVRGVEDRLLFRMPNRIVSFHLHRKIFTTICQVHRASHMIFPLAHSLFPLIINRIDALPSQEWVSWKSEHDQLLINMMVEHSHNGKKIKNGFRINAWREMVRMFNQVTGLNYDVRHLENRLKSYKREYQIVKKILAIDGFDWAPSERVVNASDADWQKILKSIPKALVYKRKQVPFKDLHIICASSSYRQQSSLTLASVNERADKISID